MSVRVLHELCDLVHLEEDRNGDPTWTTVATGVPCEFTPLSTSEKAVSTGAGYTVEEYLWVTRDATITAAESGAYRLVWRGRQWAIYGALEEHTLRGRIQHREAIVRAVI